MTRRWGGAAGQAAEGGTASEEAIGTVLKDRLRERVGQDAFDRFFARGVKLMQGERLLELRTSSAFLGGLLKRRFGKELREVAALDGQSASEIELRVQVVTAPRDMPSVAGERGARAGDEGTPAKRREQPGRQYRLAEFEVGVSNKLACSAVRSLIEGGQGVGFNLLFLHGKSGVGKTHLLRAAAAEYSAHRPGSMVRCFTGEEFTGDFVNAVKTGGLEKFRRACRRTDLLCIDDVHFLDNKSGTQGELLRTFDAIAGGGSGARCRVILASDEHPRHIGRFSDALVSRFLSGLVAKIDPPEDELRLRLLRKFAAARALTLDDAASTELSRRIGRDPTATARDIEGALIRLQAAVRLLEPGDAAAPIGVLMLDRALAIEAPARNGRTRRPVRPERIIAAVCDALGVSDPEFRGSGRARPVVLARALVAYLCRRLTSMSFPDIARAMGRSNHSTVVSAMRRADAQLKDGETCDAPGEFLGRPLRDLFEHCERSALIEQPVAGG